MFRCLCDLLRIVNAYRNGDIKILADKLSVIIIDKSRGVFIVVGCVVSWVVFVGRISVKENER